MLLHCHSYYSLRYGTLSEHQLLQLAQEHGYKALALTDINNTSACLNFVRLAAKYDVHPMLGIDFRQGHQQHWVAIACNNQGFAEINNLLSYHKHTKKPLPHWAPYMQDVIIIYPLQHFLYYKKELLPHEYVGVAPHELTLMHSATRAVRERMVMFPSLTLRDKQDHNVHRVLRAIDLNTLITKLQPQDMLPQAEGILHRDELVELYRDHPQAISNTEKICEQCSIHFDFSPDRPHQNKKRYGPSRSADTQLLEQLCQDGLSYRYPSLTTQIKSRLQKELDTIQQMDYVPFFLVNWDIVQYAKRQGYYHVGRGSGANSIVAYLLGITDVDPIELDLYFERFMNLYRTSPPDFDIDFSWRDRDDVTRYIFDRFGTEGQTALLATYNGFKHRAAVREIGKAFGMPKHEIDILSKGRYQYSSLDKLAQLTLRYAQHLSPIPNQLSVHSSGIVIAERDIHHFTATDLPPKGYPTTQFDMVIAEDVGLYKYDILGQRGLGKIKDAITIVQQNQPEAQLADIHDVAPLKQDPKINALVKSAQCIGCFYVESPAMRMLLHKLSVDNYLGLVAASSIIRPGVAKSGMMREYILRHKNPERRKTAHPVMWKLMPETYGIMVYQEDVIKVAHHFAGLDLAEADVLRRAMSGKYRSREEFEKIQDKFYHNCKERGYEDKMVQEVWNQIESFAGYAFAKGHSASYAVESYQSLYLKCYFPLEYMVATLNNGGGFYRPEFYIHEARMQGAQIHAPDINMSEYDTLIRGKDIYLGFQFLQDLEYATAKRIVEERQRGGDFSSLSDFIQRTGIGLEQLAILIRIDAFRDLGEHKRNLLWQAHLEHAPRSSRQPSLFVPEPLDFKIPELPTGEVEALFDQIELLGFPLASPFRLLAEPVHEDLLASQLPQYLGQQVTICGYLVTVKRTKTSNGKQMNFGTFIDREGQWIDTVHFPPVVRAYPTRGSGIYRIQGTVTQDSGYYSIEVTALHKLAYVPDPRYAE